MTHDIIQSARGSLRSLHMAASDGAFSHPGYIKDDENITAALDLAERLEQDNERMVKERDGARDLIRNLEMLYMDGIGNRGGGFKDSFHDGRWYESASLSQTVAALKAWRARQALGESQ